MSGDEVTLHLGHRRYRIRGLSKNLAFDQMKVNVLATTEKGMYVDTFDLYIARHRRQFVVQAAVELGVEEETIKKDLGPGAAETGRIAGPADYPNDAAEGTGPAHDGRRKGSGVATATRPEPVGPDRSRLRCSGRDDEQTGWVSCRRQPETRPTVGHHHSIVIGRRQNFAHGSHLVVCSARGSSQVFGHDGAIAVLHGRNGPEAQDIWQSWKRKVRSGRATP